MLRPLLFASLFYTSISSASITNTAQIITKSYLTGEDALHFMRSVFPDAAPGEGFKVQFAEDKFSVGCVAEFTSCLITTTTAGFTGPEAAWLRGNRTRLEYSSKNGELRITCDQNRNNLDYCNVIINNPILNRSGDDLL